MASSVAPALLTGAAAASPGSIFVATLIGSVVDAYLLPKIFAQGPRDGQRLGDLQIGDNAEGSPLWRAYGEMVRIPGLLTWTDGAEEVADRSKGGGKGSGGSFLTYKAFASAQFTLADHEIAAIEKVIVDGKLFWSSKPPVDFRFIQYTLSIESSQLFGGPVTNYLVIHYDENLTGTPSQFQNLDSGSDVTISGFDPAYPNQFDTIPPAARTFASGGLNQSGQAKLQVIDVAAGATIPVDATIQIQGHNTIYRVTAPATQVGTTPLQIDIEPVLQSTIPDFTIASRGNVAFRTNDENNDGTWEVVSTAYDQDTGLSSVKVQSRELPGYPFSTLGGGKDVTVKQKSVSSTAKYGRIALQLGGEDQVADSLLITRLTATVGSASQVIASKGSAGVLVERMDLTDFGNRLPNVEALIRPTASGDTSVANTIVELSKLCGIGESRVDVSQVTGNLRGLSIRGPQEVGASIQLLMLAFDIVAREFEDKIIFCDRDQVPFVDVELRDLGVGAPGENAKYPFEIEQVDDRKLPSRVVVKFIDPSRDYQTGSVDSIYDRPIAPNVVEINTGIVMSRDEAQALAHRSRDMAHATKFRYKGTIAHHYLAKLQPGLIMRIPEVMGRKHDILLTKWDVGVNGVIEWEGRGEDAEALKQTVTAGTQIAATASTDSPTSGGPSVVWHALDIAPLEDAHRRQPGYYVAAASADVSKSAPGFVLMTSTDGVAFSKTAEIARSSVMGSATTAPSSAGISPELIDRSTVLRVQLLDPKDTLESVTEKEMLQGHNRFMWGSEMIGAARCVFVSPGVYDLSVLRRGLGDTDDELLGHSVGDRVVWLNGGGLTFVPINHAAIGGTRKIKVVSAGGQPDLATAHDVVVAGRNVKPHRVTQVVGARDGANDLTVTWARKTRAIVADYDQGDPLDDDLDAFKVEVVSGGTVLRTVDNITASSWTYTAADQTTDGLTPGDPVTINISQKSIAFHNGRARTVTL